MPPSALGKPLVVGGTVALVGAAVWALLIVFAKYEIGILSWGIGAAIGGGIVWAGGHGMMLAVTAGALALLSIGTGKHFAFRALVDTQVNTLLERVDENRLAERRAAATAWVALGDSPTADQVRAFAKEHHYMVDSVEEFVRDDGPLLRSFAADNPDLATFRTQLGDQIRSRVAFFDYLKEDFSPYDILFAILGIASAFGIVSKATQAKQAAILQLLHEEAEAAAAAAAADANKKAGPSA